MTPEQSSSEAQIALLIEDISLAKKISDALRTLNVFAHYYGELSELCEALKTYTPDLCIVDVKKMNTPSLMLKDQKKIKTGKLNTAFLYNDKVLPLLVSTQEFTHFGLINSDIDLVTQLKSTLLRVQKEKALNSQVNELNQRVVRLKKYNHQSASKQEKAQQTLEQFEALNDLVRKFGQIKNQQEFYERVIHVFSNWDAIKDFGLYYLNNSKQKLVSPKINQQKYKKLPDLWLDEANENGIKPYALDMATDVCLNEIPGDLINIRIQGTNDSPDILLWVSTDFEKTRYFSWDILEEKLNSLYIRTLTSHSAREQSQNEQSIHNLLFELDEVQFHQVDSRYRYALLDFSSLLNMIKQRPNLRFNWKQFHLDLSCEINTVLKKEQYKFSIAAPCHFIVSLDRKNLEVVFSKLKAYVQSIECWRYFNDSSSLMDFDISASVKLISPSSVNIARLLDEGHVDLMNETTIKAPIRQGLSV